MWRDTDSTAAAIGSSTSLCTASPSHRYASAAKLEPMWADEWPSATPGPKPFAHCGATCPTRSTNDYAWIGASKPPRPKQRPLDIGVSIAQKAGRQRYGQFATLGPS